MELGVFSISLAVKDLAAPRAFYEKLGFEQIGGDEAQNYLILKNGDSITAPAGIVVVDPDGNPVLIDQHVPRPGAGS